MCEVSSMLERLVPSCLEHFWQTRERGRRLYVGPRRPGLGASLRLLLLLPRPVDAFPLWDEGNRLPAAEWFRTPGEHSRRCHLVGWRISLGMIWSFQGLRGVVWPGDTVGSNSSWIYFSHPGNIVGGSSSWRTLPSFIPCVNDGISDSGAQGFDCVHFTVVIIFMAELGLTNEKILSASNAEVGG